MEIEEMRKLLNCNKYCYDLKDSDNYPCNDKKVEECYHKLESFAIAYYESNYYPI